MSKHVNVFAPVTACIPGVNTIDGNRIQMSRNFHLQAVFTKQTEYPLLSTPVLKSFAAQTEYYVVRAKHSGTVYVHNRTLILEYDDGSLEVREIDPYIQILVKNAQKVHAGDIVAKHINIDPLKGVAFGVHLNVAFTNRYTFEDSILLTESGAEKLESTHYDIIDIPITSKYFKINTRDLQIGNIIEVGTSIIEFFKNPLSFLVMPSRIEYMPETSEVVDIEIQMFEDSYKCDEFSKEFIQNFSLQSKKNVLLAELPEHLVSRIQKIKSSEFKQEYDYIGIIRISYKYTKKFKVGDKLANRYGNKGVVSKIISDEEARALLHEEFPMLKGKYDFFQPEIFINPLGVTRRMNITQLVEFSLLYICKYSIPRFVKHALEQGKDPEKIVHFILENTHKRLSKEYYEYILDVFNRELSQLSKHDKHQAYITILKDILQNGLELELDAYQEDFPIKAINVIKYWDKNYYELLDPRPFKGCGIGVMYTLKLEHMVDKKLKSVSTDKYSTKTMQPLEGQKAGEMELTTIGAAYGAEYTLWSFQKPKSDEHLSKIEAYNKIVEKGSVSIDELDDKPSRMSNLLRSLLRVIDVELKDTNDSE